MIPFLIGIPAVLAVVFQIIRNEKMRGYIVYGGAGVIMAMTVLFYRGLDWQRSADVDLLSADRDH